jgi:copper(I)-binding protein
MDWKSKGLLKGLIAVCVGGMLADPPAAAHGYAQGDLHVRHPWTRATAAGERLGVAYLEIRNSGRAPDRLISASTPAGERVELHGSRSRGDTVKMREVKAIEVPARRRLILRPGGSQLVIVGLKKPLVKGDRVPLTLYFERAGEMRVELEVQPGESGRPHH